MANFSILAPQIDLILHIVIVLSVFQHMATLPGHEGSFKKPRNAFLNDPKSPKRGFWPFSWVWSVESIDVAYCDSNKCFPTFGNVIRSCRIIQGSQKCIFEWSKEPKKRFLALFCSLVCWIDLILHIVIVLNVFQLLAMLPGHEESFKDRKNAFLNDPKAQKLGFWPFFGVWCVRSTWYFRSWWN